MPQGCLITAKWRWDFRFPTQSPWQFSLGMEGVPLLPAWLSLGFDLHRHYKREAVPVLAGRGSSPVSLLQYHLIAARWESLSGLHWHCRERLLTAKWGWEFYFSTWLLRHQVGSALLHPGKSGSLGSHLREPRLLLIAMELWMGQHKTRWLDGIINSMDMSLSKL